MNLQKQNWQRVKLGSVTQIIGGGTPSRNNPEYFGGEILWINATDIPKNKIAEITDTKEKITELGLSKSSARLLPKGAILLTTRATVGEVAIAGKEITTTQSLENFVPNENQITSWFLAYWLHANKSLILSNSSGTTFKGITRKILAEFLLPLPPLEEQHKIAELFQSIDASIEQAEEQEKNLLNLKNQMLRELFGGKRQFGNYLKEDDFEKVKFEQIAFNISERVEPQETDYTIYIGLEHLDPDNLKIERKGKPEDVIGTKLKIYEGDIIFGKRRAYQRKVAIADFEGICSAHSMVLRANEKMIEKDLLPFFMQSDVFMNRAVQVSEGSLSPTIKWKVLANQEFVIPKREKQKQLAETFIHFDKVIGEIRQQKQTLKNLKFKLLNEILG